MCPLCISNAALVAVSATSCASLGFVVVKLRTLRRQRRKAAHVGNEINQPGSIKSKLGL